MPQARTFFINDNARTYAEQHPRKKRPRDVGRLCWAGYHQPEFEPAGQCRAVGCRCYCHHPLEVEGYKKRYGQCKTCRGVGRISGPHRITMLTVSVPCHMCEGSGYGPGAPVTMARTPEQKGEQHVG